MFWGLLLNANKRYSQVVTKAFHVSHATLDLTSCEKTDVIQLWICVDGTNYLLCNLGKTSSHVPLDLAFTEGENIALFTKGDAVVHLSGFLIPEEPDYDLEGLNGEDSEEELSDEDDADVTAPTKKQQKQKKQNKGKAAQDDEEDEDEEESDDDELEKELAMDEDDSDDSDEEESDEEESDGEEEIEEPVPALMASKKRKLEVPPKENGTANGKASKKNKNKPQEPQTQKQQPQQQQPKQIQPQQKSAEKPGKKTLAGGVVAEDLRVGKGPEAKPGKRVQVYYEGRLKSGKVFDSSKSGDGFRFSLGRGEVIKGWDVGVTGMKVGGKRRITCPPNYAYGQKGSPPVIPGNSTLVFDIELRGVN